MHWDFAYHTDEESCHDRLDLVRRTIDAPYRLKLLGGLGLEGPKKLSGRVTQRRQMALLALLEGHGAPLSRDKLIGLLWPETDTDRARHILSDSVYIIRKELGENAIVTTGEGVTLDSAVVGSDLADFRSAMTNESYEDALASYVGSFLDGFFPDESEPYERWMTDKREALQREAARATWTLVDHAEAAGEVHEAVRWARRALEIVPEDETGVRRLIRLQDACGDRAGAVRTYEEFTARLAADLDVTPSEETEALITTIRERLGADRQGDAEPVGGEPFETSPAPPGAVEAGDARPAVRRPKRSPRRAVWIGAAVAIVLLAGWLSFSKSEGGSSATVAEGPATVAVLPFEVRGEELEVWREGMVDLVSRNVDVFSETRAVPSRTVLARWREAGFGNPTDQTGALEVAREAEARYAVTGSVVGIGQGLLIRGELYDVQTGAKLGDARVEGAPDSIFSLVDRLSVALMEPLLAKDVQDRRWPRLASVTTSSPEALESFLEGEKLYGAGEYQRAIEAFRRAIEADSTFALAYYRLSEAYTWTSAQADFREFIRLAARYTDRLPEREARLIRAWHLGSEGRSEEWIGTLRKAVREYPDDPQAWYWLGEAYYHAGGEMLIRPWEFIDAFERSVELDPFFAPAWEHLIDAAFLREPDSARVRRIIEERDLTEGALKHEEAAFRIAFGGPYTRAEARELLRDESSFFLRAIAISNLTHPRFLDRREMVLRIALENPDPSYERVIRSFLFSTLVARGRVGEAVETSDHSILEHNRATMLFEARAMGYPIPEETLVRALENAPAKPEDRESALPDDRRLIQVPAIFERAAYAVEMGDWGVHAAGKRDLETWISAIGPENASDTLRVRGLIRALDGYAAWRRGDLQHALDLLKTARVETTGYGGHARSISDERNRIVRAWLGELLLEMDRPRDALVYFESLGPGWPLSQDPMMYFRMGQLRDRLGDREGAREAYELAALAWRDPDPAMRPFAETARSEAARLRGLIRQ